MTSRATTEPELCYAIEPELTASEFIDVLRRSTLAERRPVDKLPVIEGMLRHATVIATARIGPRLVGVARAISDRSYCTYLSDLAVDAQYQRQGIGRSLLELTHSAAGRQTTLIVLAAPAAQDYYRQIGLQPHEHCWIQPPDQTATCTPPATCN